MKNVGSGLGDPYWYEWSVGLHYVVDMLDSESGIAAVTLQQTGEKGLDDVVLRFGNGDARFIQVKHTRVEASLTFGDLVAGEDGEPPLLRQIAEAWNTEARRTTGNCEAWLVTNRAAGHRRAGTKGATPIVRPPLDEYLAHVGKEIVNATTLASVNVPAEWQDAWTREWLPQLDALGSDSQKLQFMRRFRVQTSEENLDEIGERLLSKLKALFAVDRGVALRMRAFLDSALRTWATSLRGSAQAITREDAYEKLCLAADVAVGEHELAPPAPFFETRIPVGDEIASLVASRAEPVVFVVGEPGSGKTALLSSLANRRDPVIDLRFHAYRPITPENQLLPADAGRTTTARALWSDLLLQIRPLVRGRLAQLQVPVHAGSLSEDDLRAHVLRLADALGELQRRPLVIAIDGIDHAARAGASTESFLTSLIPPDQVPSRVVFLIGGQPPEGNASYPAWLRSPTRGVKRVNLPRLSFDDTLGLIRTRLPQTPMPDLENVARDVWQHCEGHTLSTVFAVEEAVLRADDLSRLATLLDTRQIASGVEAYYEHIWSAATRAFLLQATRLRLAACLCLMPIRATAATVEAILDASESGVANWGDHLRQLRPLVVEDRGGFRVFHNDVRVFLHRLLQADPDVYRDCASRLAGHLMTGEDAAARHAAAQSLFGVAGRHADQARIFSPKYVLEGHAIGQPLDALTEQGLAAADALEDVPPDWDLAHEVATGLRTLEQLRSSLEWRGTGDRTASAMGASTVPTKPAERRVPRRGQWSYALVNAALDDFADLEAIGEHDRAVGAFRRWFAGLSPAEIATAASSHSPEEIDYATEDTRQTLMAKLGQVCVAIRVMLPPSEGLDVDEVEADFASGLLAGAANCEHILGFARVVRRMRQAHFLDVQKLLARLVERRAWILCKLLLDSIRSDEGQPWPYRLQAAAAAALVGDPKLREIWVAPLLAERAATIAHAVSFTHGTDMEVLTAMTWAAFLFSLEEPNREASGIRAEIETVYRMTPHSKREDAAVSQLLYAAALLGSYVRTTRDSTPRAAHLKPEVVALTIEGLMTTARGPERLLPSVFPNVAAAVVKGIVECSMGDPDVAEAVRYTLAGPLQAGLALGVFLEIAWRTLARVDHRKDLITYADRWVGPRGLAWSEAPDDRYDIIGRLALLLAEVGEHTRADAARARLPWVEIGYGVRKEFVLRQPLAWFEALAQQSPSAWQAEGLRLLAISREASRTGDNRFSREIDAELVTAACIEGPASLARLFYGPPSVFKPGDRCVVGGLIGLVEGSPVDRKDLLAIWAFCTGVLCWQVDNDRLGLAEVRDALMTAAQRMGVADLPALMAKAAPAEFECEAARAEVVGATVHQYEYLARLPVDEAMRRACRLRDWGGVATLLERIAAENPPEGVAAIEFAWKALTTRAERIWHIDGADPAYLAIFPLLSAAKRWEGIRRAAPSYEDDVPAFRTNTLAENLDDLCRLAAVFEGREMVQRGLQRLLDMHEMWISGDGKLAPLRPISLADSPASPGWRPLFVDLLFELLAYDEEAYVQAALRSLYQLLTLDSALSAQAVALARGAEPEVRRRFLFLAEALACKEAAGEVRAWLASEVASSPRLDSALSAWSALRFAQRAIGKLEPEWPLPVGVPPLIEPVATPLLIRLPKLSGLYTSVGRASTEVLDQLEAASGIAVADLEAELAASIREDPPQSRPPRSRGVPIGDMRPNPEGEAELGRFFSLLRVRERQGRFARVPTGRLAQALVPFADPFVFLRTPRTCLTADSWPMDDQLDKIVQSDLTSLGARLAALMEDDLETEVRLIAGLIRSFSRKWDVKVSVDHVIPVGMDLEKDQRPRILCARASLALEELGSVIASPGARDQVWLTQEVVGLMALVDATLDFFPSWLWRQRLSWEPKVDDPLTWTREGHRVAWFERLRGPVRHLSPSDFMHRQPTIARWVCIADEWQRIIDILGPPRRRVRPEHAAYGEE